MIEYFMRMKIILKLTFSCEFMGLERVNFA